MNRILLLICIVIPRLAISQSEVKTSQAFLFTPHIAFHKVGGDMKERFNNFNSLGMNIDYKFKNNFVIGLDYDWFFGRSVKDNGIFSNINGKSGLVIDQNGDFSVINLLIKGNYATINLGYLINLPRVQSNSGILIQLGGGFMQHKIDIYSSQVTIPQLNGDYEKGYDQLAYGLATKQFVGYQYLVNHSRYHLRAGLEFNQGFTKGRRTWNFNTNESGLDQRFDATVALKLGIIVPIYTKKAEDEEFFYN
ncbi:hypothetical protein OAP07_00290 [Bacteroidia bacterium]|jgi:hypothetical protein|nr:hypothetical protein [Bacteroidia bacterium]MDC0560493.1 hypothetical protein [Bacteroidia bacterium]MDC3406681.1 hypothetical protein [Bacteroidia bacterium]